MIDHIGFPVSDYERAKAFYLRLLRLQNVGDLCLLIRIQVQVLGEHFATFRGIKATLTVARRRTGRSGLLIGTAVFLRHRSHRIEKAGKHQREHSFFQHRISFQKSVVLGVFNPC